MNEPFPEPRVLIGAHGWQHPGWNGTFYPDDLPEDWRLGYYGNEFPLVGVPAGAWSGSGPQDWLEDSGGHLRFLCELPVPGMDAARAVGELEVLGPRCLGVILTAPVPEAVVPELRRRWPLAWAGAGEPPPALREAGAGRCWDGSGAPPPGGRLNVIRLAAAAPSPRELRGLLEAALAWPGTDHTVLLFTAADPSVEAMHAAATLLELM